MGSYRKYLIYLVLVFISNSCKEPINQKMVPIDSHQKEIEYKNDNPNKSIVTIFGVKSKREEIDFLNNLQQNGILTIDSISSDESGFKYAIVEFAGVKFGVNKGFSFLTSRKDKVAIESIVQKISEFYSEPWIDNEDKGEPQYQYYGWNTIDPLKPSIRIRPLHSDEGGLVMFWEFPL